MIHQSQNINFLVKYFFKGICLLYILLLTYTAVSKLLEFETFRIQLGQSPIVSIYADFLSLAVPTVEIILAALLLFPAYQRLGLVGGIFLMSAFTVYIYLMLYHSSYLPCSCGGILEEMNWHQHFYFNLVVTLFGIAAWAVNPSKLSRMRLSLLLLVVVILGGVTTVSLYYQSDYSARYENPFIRRYPPHAAQEMYRIDLRYNSYYFAGQAQGKIFLGNYTAPLLVTTINTSTREINTATISLQERHLPFRQPLIKVLSPHFFVYEGSVPYIFKGNTKTWSAKLKKQSGNYFSLAEPTDEHTLLVRFIEHGTGENKIGIINLSDTTDVRINDAVLKKQVDGIFDTDGQLHFNDSTQKWVYVYRYRNQFIVGRAPLEVSLTGNTIDTITQVKLKLRKIQTQNYTTFSEPPVIVNQNSAINTRLLFVHSMLPGKYEQKSLWKNASIIDVYAVDTGAYLSSFPIYHIDRSKMKSFIAVGQKIYALIGDQLVCYQLLAHLEPKIISEKAY